MVTRIFVAVMRDDAMEGTFASIQDVDLAGVETFQHVTFVAQGGAESRPGRAWEPWLWAVGGASCLWLSLRSHSSLTLRSVQRKLKRPTVYLVTLHNQNATHRPPPQASISQPSSLPKRLSSFPPRCQAPRGLPGEGARAAPPCGGAGLAPARASRRPHYPPLPPRPRALRAPRIETPARPHSLRGPS